MAQDRVTARFGEYEGLVAALARLREAGVERFHTYSPVPLTEHEDLLPRQGSPVRWVALVMGVAGAVAGFSLCIMASRMYSQIVAGKAVVALVPFGVIGFELTVLAAALATMASVFACSRLFPRPLPDDYAPEFGLDSFGVTVLCGRDERDAIREMLEGAGADEVVSA